jgi:peptidoglycan/LPS O-acetylase OafA/YrhL
LRIRWEQRPPRLRWPLDYAETWIGASAVVWALIFDDLNREYLAIVAAFLLMAACVLPLRSVIVGRMLDWRPLAWVSIVSYSLYMWQIPILNKLQGASWMPVGFAGFFPITLLICFAVAFVSYRLVERPFQRKRRHWGSTNAAPLPVGQAGA